MAEKEATVFIIDIGKSMGLRNNGRDVTDLDWALQWLWDRVTNIVSLGRKTFYVGVIALGSDGTKNNMSEDASYSHITVLQPMTPMLMPELRMLSPLIKPSNTDNRDAMSSIILAVDMVLRHCRHLQYRKKIYLLTNATGPMDPDDIDSTAEQIKQNNIELTVLGVDFDDAEHNFKEEHKLPVKAKNEKLLGKLVDKCAGNFGTMREAIEGLAIPHIKPIKPIPTFKGQLRLGDPSVYETAITIDIERYFKASVRHAPTASSFVMQTEASETQSGLAMVTTSRVYTVSDSAEPQGERNVERDELARGYQYGRTAVPITDSDENITKLETDSGYEILGFIPKGNVERYMILDNTNVLVAQRGNNKAMFALSSLIHALFEIDSCAIARFVKKDMSEPILTLLTPYVDDEIEYLNENILPYSEDLRQYRFAPIDNIITISGKRLQSHRNLPSNDLVDAMSAFVDDMTIRREQIRIEDTYSPILHTIEGAIRYRAVHTDGSLPTVPESLVLPSKPSQELRQQSRASLRGLIAAADVKKVPPKVRGRRRYREPEKPLSGLNISDLFGKENRIKISSENAIPEFKQAVEATESLEAVHDAARQLMLIVEDHIRNSFGNGNYERVIEELTVLRNELKELEEFDLWHELIRSLKQKILSEELGVNRKEMWWKIRVNKLGLINNAQEQNARITQAESDAFLSSS